MMANSRSGFNHQKRMRRQAEQPVASCSIDTLREKVYPCRALRGEPLKGERSESHRDRSEAQTLDG